MGLSADRDQVGAPIGELFQKFCEKNTTNLKKNPHIFEEHGGRRKKKTT